LTATVANATDTSVTWDTSDHAIATVTGGVVTGVAAGSVTVTATSVADPTKSASKVITVNPAVTVVIAGPDSVVAGNDITLTATVANATDTSVTWESADPTIATVTAGVVHGVKAGTVKITATSVADTTIKAEKTITVVPAVSVTISGVDQLGLDLTATFTATVENATDTSVTWESADPTIATIDAAGLVTGVKVGTTKIKAISVADPTKYAEKDIEILITTTQMGTKIKYAKNVTGAFEETVTTSAANDAAHYYYKMTAATADIYYVALSDSTVDSAAGGTLTTVSNDIVIYGEDGVAISVDSLSSSATLATEANVWKSEHIFALKMAAGATYYIGVSPAYDSATSYGYGTTKVTVSTATGDRPEEAVDYTFGATQSFNIAHDVQRQFYKIHLDAGTYKWTGSLHTFFYADIYAANDLTTKVASYLRTDASFITVTTAGDYYIAVAGYTNTGTADSFTLANPADGEIPSKAIALTLGTSVKVGKGGGFAYYSVAFKTGSVYRISLKNPSDSKGAAYYVYSSVADATAGGTSTALAYDEEEYSYGSYDTSDLIKKYTATADGTVIIKAGYKGSTSSSVTAFDFLVEEVLPGSSIDSAIATTGGSIQPGVSGKYYSFVAPTTDFYNVSVSGATGTTSVALYASSNYARASGVTAAGMVFGASTTYTIFVSDTVDEAVTLTIAADAGTAMTNGGTATIGAEGYIVRKFTAAESNFYDFTISGVTGTGEVSFWSNTATSGYSTFSATKDTATGNYGVSGKKIASGTSYWVMVKGTAADAVTFAFSGISAVATAPTVAGTATTAAATTVSTYSHAYMKIDLVAGKYYSFVATSTSGKGEIGLLNPDLSDAKSSAASISYKPTVSGTYYLDFYSSAAETITATMNISDSAPQDGESFDTAFVITTTTTVSSSGNPKYISFTPTADGTYAFYSVSGKDFTGSLYLATDTGMDTRLVYNDDGGSSHTDLGCGSMDFYLTYACTAGTTYMLKVGYGSASFVIHVALTA